MWKLPSIALLSLVLFAATIGCASVSPIAPLIQIGIMWMEGEAHKYYATDQQTIHAAVKDVLEEFKLPILEESNEDNTIYIKAGDDDRFKIKIVAVRENVTKLSIRVNIMGDKPYAEMLYRHVDEQPNVEQFASVASLNESLEKQSRPKRMDSEGSRLFPNIRDRN